MQIYIGSDHGGFEHKEALRAYLSAKHPDLDLEDCGFFSFNPADDYPLIALSVAQKVASAKQQALGIILCRSGSGVVVAANKVKGVRAVEIYNSQIAAHAKSHNQANVITFAGDYLSFAEMTNLLEIFLATPIDEHPRHQRRIDQISNYENNN